MKIIKNLKAEELRKSILQLAIQGKLVKQDPNDEPASELAKKIKKEKEKLILEGKIKKEKEESFIFKGDDNCYYEKIGKNNPIKLGDLPFTIPENWTWVRMKNVSNLIGGYAFKSSKFSKKGIRVIRISDFDEFGIKNNEIKRYPYSSILGKFKISIGNILFCMTGGTVGKSLLIDKINEDSYINQRVALLDIKNVNNIYVYNLLSSQYILRIIDKSKNSTNDNISMKLLEEILIPLPPLDEQERIVKKIQSIDLLIQQYNEYETKLTKLESEFEEKIKKSILQYAIQGKLVKQDPNDEPASELVKKIYDEKQKLILEGKIKRDKYESRIYQGTDKNYYEKIDKNNPIKLEDLPFKIPENWTWIRLKNIFSINAGATFKKEDSFKDHKEGMIRILRGGNILSSKYILKSDDIYIPDKLVSKNILLNIYDLITPIVSSLENIGKIAIIDSNLKDITVGGFVYIFRLYFKNKTISNIVHNFICSPHFQNTLKNITRKSGQAFYNLGKEKLSELYLPIPPLVEQERIVKKIQSIDLLILQNDKKY